MPQAIKAAQEHFGCENITTVQHATSVNINYVIQIELEDGEKQHFEKRLFNYEVMTSSLEANPVVSKISLAVIESSGWYEVDYDIMAEPFLWGLNAVRTPQQMKN